MRQKGKMSKLSRKAAAGLALAPHKPESSPADLPPQIRHPRRLRDHIFSAIVASVLAFGSFLLAWFAHEIRPDWLNTPTRAIGLLVTLFLLFIVSHIGFSYYLDYINRDKLRLLDQSVRMGRQIGTSLDLLNGVSQNLATASRSLKGELQAYAELKWFNRNHNMHNWALEKISPRFLHFPCTEDEYCADLLDALNQCKTWLGIHEGSLKFFLTKRKYTDYLNDTTTIDKKYRILVRHPGNEPDFDPEGALLREYIKATPGITTFYIHRYDIKDKYGELNKPNIQDWALFENCLVLEFDRQPEHSEGTDEKQDVQSDADHDRKLGKMIVHPDDAVVNTMWQLFVDTDSVATNKVSSNIIHPLPKIRGVRT